MQTKPIYSFSLFKQIEIQHDFVQANWNWNWGEYSATYTIEVEDAIVKLIIWLLLLSTT